ncbi:MAG: hypothetical protein ABDH32_00965 [Candidatus Caldarchaeales archaeon]
MDRLEDGCLGDFREKLAEGWMWMNHLESCSTVSLLLTAILNASPISSVALAPTIVKSPVSFHLPGLDIILIKPSVSSSAIALPSEE